MGKLANIGKYIGKHIEKHIRTYIGVGTPLFALLCIIVIIFVTPWLYRCHPYTSDKPVNRTVDPVTTSFRDTIRIQGDSLICQSRTVENLLTLPAEESSDMGELGTFGDSAGFWNAIFSAVAMILVVITLFVQLNKDAKDDERARLAQFQEQCLAMLSMLSEIVAQLRMSPKAPGSSVIELPKDLNGEWNLMSNDGLAPDSNSRSMQPSYGSDITGRACFKYLYDESPGSTSIKGYIFNNYSDGRKPIRPSEELYTSLRKITETYFDHYFRTLYRIFLFIKDAELGDIEQEKQDKVRELCADLVRAQLSNYELAVLYYNGLCPAYRKTSKQIYEHFCIFDNLDPRYLILPEEQNYYSEVQELCANPSQYDATIHYHFTAFTNKGKTQTAGETTVESGNSESTGSKANDVNAIEYTMPKKKPDREISDDGKKVIECLQKQGGEAITFNQLKQKTGLGMKTLAGILAKNKYLMDVVNTKNGKRYRLK